MVLTNFELWAADGSSATSLPLDSESNTHTRHLNPFDPRVVPQINTNHLSSNGYYGFSYINAAHISDNNNNNNNSNDNNNNISGTAAYNLMANDVNGMNNNNINTVTTTTPQQTHTSSVNFSSSAHAAGYAVNVARCKRRYFDINHDATSAATVTNNYDVLAKRCRFDDDYSAQYCNDFFQLPSTQIATQSCLMDIEEAPQQQHMLPQQQVDEAMFENNNNIVKYEQNTNRQLENVQMLTAQNHQQQENQHSQQQHVLQTQQQPQPLQQQQQQQNLYHHQQYYQDIYATITNHSNNNHSCDTLTLNNTKQTCQIVTNKTENVFISFKLKPKNNPKFSENEKFKKTDNDVVANDLKVDDATLFTQLHGGCLHHHHNFSSSIGNYKSKDENYNEEF